MKTTLYFYRIFLILSSLASLSAHTECRIRGLHGVFPKGICKAFEEIKPRTKIESPEDYQPIRDMKLQRLYSRVVFVGPPGTGKSITAERMADQAGAIKLIRSAPSLVTEYIGGGSEEINTLKEQALDLYEDTGKHVVIIINEIDALVRNNQLDPSSTAYKSYHNASEELWNLLSDFEDDPRLSIIMTANTLEDADPQFLSRMRGRTIPFKNPDAIARKELIERNTNDSKLDFFEQFAEGYSTSPVLHQAYKNGKLNDTLNFMETRPWFSWIFSRKTYLPNKEYQEKQRDMQMTCDSDELDDTGNSSEFNYISSLIKKALLQRLEQELDGSSLKNISSQDSTKTQFNKATISFLTSITQNFSYRDLCDFFEKVTQLDSPHLIQLRIISEELTKNLEEENLKQRQKESDQKKINLQRKQTLEIQRNQIRNLQTYLDKISRP